MSETEGFAEPDGFSALREALETAQAGEVPEDSPLPSEPAMDLLEAAWGIIANAGEGDWDSQRPEWREAAERWRDRYHAMLRAFCAQGTTKSLADMTAEVDAYCQAKGWREKPVSFGEAMALLHSEVSEALEAWRNWGLEDATRAVLAGRGDDGSDLAVPHPKPEGVGSEFADVLIRLLDDCAIFGIDLEAEYERKMQYNRTRAYKHGGRTI